MLAELTVEASLEPVLDRLRNDDVLGQLLERRGRAAELATEAGDVKLAWAGGLAWLLDHPEALATIEGVAADLRRSGIRHLVWAGMGGSVQTVHALAGLGFFENAGVMVHPLDSTDPAALNRLLREIDDGGGLSSSLRHTAMVGVSMGMTSEEPITHLEWFDGLLKACDVPDRAAHVTVMTLEGSLLDQFARARGSRQLSIQPDGESHTPGRMSAPATHVFLLPAALALSQGDLGGALERCQAELRLRSGLPAGERSRLIAEDPFVRLAAWLHLQIAEGRDMVLLDMEEQDRALAPWVEQVVEESLGKEGRGLLVFHQQDLSAAALWPDRFSVLRVGRGSGPAPQGRPVAQLTLGPWAGAAERLAVVARFFAGWNLTVALLGYLEGITFAGQPAVEGYKRYARELRDRAGDLPYPGGDLVTSTSGKLELSLDALSGAGVDEARIRSRAAGWGGGPAAVLAATAATLRDDGRLGYLDVTLNADPDGALWAGVGSGARDLAYRGLQRPVKVRSGPRDYHSTEQSETDGPPDLLSVRLLVRETEDIAAGSYSNRFLHAQALGTVAAMRDARRPVLLGLLSGAGDVRDVDELFGQAARLLSG